ncbi:RnfABCDGE type electron transport complex subunit D [Guggenheimella bovis]
MEQRLFSTSSPHIRTNEDITRVMLDVIIALLPAVACAVYFFGVRTLAVIGIAILFAVITEVICQKAMGRPNTIGDLSAVVTGLLLGLNLSSAIPLWIPAVGGVFAIFIVKEVFGGIGQNYMNPALAARVFLAISYTQAMGVFKEPMTDAVSQATALTLLKSGAVNELPKLQDMLIGNMAGSLGETSAIALLIGGIYLLVRKVIDWRIPTFFILTTFVMSFLLYEMNPTVALQAVLSGGVMIGAFFMATDFVTCPVTPVGRVIFAIGCGLLTVLIRRFGAYPEGVMFAILLMNAMSPAIEKFTAPKVFGGRK